MGLPGTENEEASVEEDKVVDEKEKKTTV